MATFKAIEGVPSPAKYPHAYRWYKHIQSYSSEFSSLPGDPSKSYTEYGPDSPAPAAPAAATEAAPKADEEEEEIDLFGSDEEEDVEAVKKREANLAAYRLKKEGKEKPVAKSMVTLDVKPWGVFCRWNSAQSSSLSSATALTFFSPSLFSQMMRPI